MFHHFFQPSNTSKCDIYVKRSRLFETSLEAVTQIANDDPGKLRNKLWIEFEDERGLDYGGVSRYVTQFYLLSGRFVVRNETVQTSGTSNG